MSEKIKRSFGIWMDNHHATIVGRDGAGTGFTVVGHAKNPGPGPNSNENTAHNLAITLVQKYFKEIGSFLENADEIHLTGTGTIQEQFQHHLGNTPQFKRTVVSESTSNPMSEEKLVEFVSNHFK